MRLIDADALRDALDADPTITADVYDILDAAPTVNCEGCKYAMRGQMDTHRGQPIGPCLTCACGSHFEAKP